MVFSFQLFKKRYFNGFAGFSKIQGLLGEWNFNAGTVKKYFPANFLDILRYNIQKKSPCIFNINAACQSMAIIK